MKQRLDEPGIVDFAPDARYLNADTQIFNIRNRAGAAAFYRKNSPQILFAAAQLIANLHAQGKRSLVVAKKKFAATAATDLERHLVTLTGRSYRVVCNASASEIADPLVVPLITYGSQGINLYEDDFYAAIALCSFNARQNVVDDRLNDDRMPDEQVKVDFHFARGYRRARPTGYFDRRQGYGSLADAYQHHLEMSRAEQALGRVRFIAKSRLVVFFQMGKMRYPAHEFTTLQAFRDHFGLLTSREWQRRFGVARIATLLAQGATTAQIIRATGMPRRTVARHLAVLRCATNAVPISSDKASWHTLQAPGTSPAGEGQG